MTSSKFNAMVSSRPPVLAFSGKAQLQNVVKRMNHWLQRKRPTNTPNDYEIAPQQRRKVRLEVRTRGSKKLQEHANPNKSLKAYFHLPVTEYNLLDPEWIERAPSKGSSAFRVTVPIYELVNIDMKPVFDVRVRANPHRNHVAFIIEGVSFGNEYLDQSLAISVRSTLSSTPNKRFSPRSLLGKRESPEVESLLQDYSDLTKMRDVIVSLEGDDSESQETESYNQEIARDDLKLPDKQELIMQKTNFVKQQNDENDETLINLNCQIRLLVRAAIPPILALIPRIILKSTGRIILRAILNAALPNFLDLVAADYHAWAIDSPDRFTPKGSLFKTDNQTPILPSQTDSVEDRELRN